MLDLKTAMNELSGAEFKVLVALDIIGLETQKEVGEFLTCYTRQGLSIAFTNLEKIGAIEVEKVYGRTKIYKVTPKYKGEAQIKWRVEDV